MRWIQILTGSIMDPKRRRRRENVMEHNPSQPNPARGRNPEVEAEYQAAMARIAQTEREYEENTRATMDRIKAWGDERYETAIREKEQREREADQLREEALAAQQERIAEMDAIMRGEVDLRELFPDFPFPERR